MKSTSQDFGFHVVKIAEARLIISIVHPFSDFVHFNKYLLRVVGIWNRSNKTNKNHYPLGGQLVWGLGIVIVHRVVIEKEMLGDWVLGVAPRGSVLPELWEQVGSGR